MRAVVAREFGSPDVMKVEDVPEPTAANGQVRIRVAAVGVNPVDTYIRSGTYARKPALPYTPGTDIAGVVDMVGGGVTRFQAGDRVYAYVAAGAAELAVCDQSQAHPLPQPVSFQQGAAMGVPYATAWRALVNRAQAQAGETVLIHGASGGVGTAAVQIARARGLNVIGTAGTSEGITLVREQGAHHVLNHSEADYLQQLLPLTGGRGVDVVVEMLANVNLDRDLDVLAPRGRVVIVGNRGRIEIDPRKAMARDAAILGVMLFNGSTEEMEAIHAGLVAGLENGSLRPVVGREFALAEMPAAHAAVMEAGARGKVVVNVQEQDGGPARG